jgi:glucokinase
MYVIGLDLGGTKLSGAVFKEDGTIVKQDFLSLEKRQGKEVGELIIKLVKDFLSYSDEKNISVSSIGICIPGIAYRNGNVWAPNIPGWDNYPLLEELNSAVKGKNIKVKIDSDRACYILGEVWQGSAKGCKDAIFLAVGTGIGAGILVDGKVMRGSNDIAGAIGWLALDRPFEQKYVSCGCFEYHASGEGLAKVANEFIGQNPTGILSERKSGDLTARDVFSAYDSNDANAVAVINQAIEFWGMTVANLVSLFNPEKIIFGGGVFGPAVKFLDRIMVEARKWAQPISINQVTLEGSVLGSNAGLIGAGYLALTNE